MPAPHADDPRATFGANLRSARERAGLTQEALGHRAEFHPTEVNRIERGRRNPGLLTIIKLAKALDVPASDLLTGLLSLGGVGRVLGVWCGRRERPRELVGLLRCPARVKVPLRRGDVAVPHRALDLHEVHAGGGEQRLGAVTEWK